MSRIAGGAAADALDENDELELEGGPNGEPAPEPEGADVKAADKPVEKPAVDPEVKRLQREARDARRLAKENEESARYWAEQARVKTPAAAAEPVDDLADVDLVSEISTNGTKGLETVLNRLGYVKKQDVLAEIGATRVEITEQAALLRDYPDLADEKSPFFRQTAAIYNSLKTDPNMAKSPKLIATAARLAKAEMGNASQRRPIPPVDDEGYDVDDRNEQDEHAQRVARQSGDRGQRTNATEPERLSQSQRDMVAKFAAAGAPVTEEGYMKRAQAGIRMGGQPSRRSAR